MKPTTPAEVDAEKRLAGFLKEEDTLKARAKAIGFDNEALHNWREWFEDEAAYLGFFRQEIENAEGTIR
jgi:hypothetical protein